MAQIVSIHSYRRGTGKSTVTANVALLMAQAGQRVGVMDANLHAPGIHLLLGLREEDIGFTLNDFLWGKCRIEQAAHDITPPLAAGKLFLLPNTHFGAVRHLFREEHEDYGTMLLSAAVHNLQAELALDVLLVDPPAGLCKESFLIMALSHTVALLLRPDVQDHQGTGTLLSIARRLGVPHTGLLVNEVPAHFEHAALAMLLEQLLGASVIALLPHEEALAALMEPFPFVHAYPTHPLTATFRAIADNLARSQGGRTLEHGR